MTTLAHAWHQFRFDVLRMRWWLAGYVVVAVALNVRNDRPGSLAALLTLGIGMLAAATVVQSDPPADPIAFWQGKPLSRWGLVLTKLLFALVLLVALPVLLLAVLLHRATVPGPEQLDLLTAAITGTVVWLSVAIGAAAVTRDLRTTPLVLIGGTIASIGLSQWEYGSAILKADVGLLQAAVAGGTIVLLLLLYIGGRGRRIGVACAMVIATLAVATGGRRDSASTPGAVELKGASESIRIIDPLLSAPRQAVNVRFATIDGASKDARYVVRGMRFMVYYDDGDSASRATHAREPVETRLGAGALPAGVNWADTLPIALDSIMADDFGLRDIPKYEQLPARRIVRLVLTGNLYRFREDRQFVMPWREGEVVRASGEEFRLTRRTRSGEIGPIVAERVRLVPSSASTPALGFTPERRRYESYILIDAGRREARRIPVQGVGSATDMYVLPSVTRRSETAQLAELAPLAEPAASASHNLLVTSWRLEGYIPVRTELRIAP